MNIYCSKALAEKKVYKEKMFYKYNRESKSSRRTIICANGVFIRTANFSLSKNPLFNEVNALMPNFQM